MKLTISKEEIERSHAIDRGALAARMYRTLKARGLMNPDGSPTAEAIRRLNQELNKFDGVKS